MNEQDLKRAFQDVMVASSQPPSMDPSRALGVAHKARSRRRATWAGAAVAVLVVGVGLGSVVVAGGASPGLDAGRAPVQPTASESPKSTPPSSIDTEYTGRTQLKGPEADKGKQLLNDLVASVPQGHTAKQAKYSDPNYNGSDMQTHQAQNGADWGKPEWEYMVITPVQKGGAVGKLLAQVHVADSKLPKEPCALAQTFWGMTGECSVVDLNGMKVGVVTKPTGGREDFDSWAAYRHGDGTVVFLAQSTKFEGSGAPALGSPLFTTQKLAELAIDRRFDIT